MFYRLRRSVAIRRFDRAIAGIHETPPLRVQDAPWSIVSMVANHDVPMYLLALKSFYARLRRGKVVAIIDRAMPQATRDTLSRHVVGIEFAILEDIAVGTCQRGGTWERLLFVLDRSATEYAIQLDADTITVGPDVAEVEACLAANRSFTLADGYAVVSLPQAAETARATPGDYIGLVTERLFDRHPQADTLRYVRASSGFTGFSRGGFTRAGIANFHEVMEGLVGSVRFREWGTEQCGSNFAVANAPDPVILPNPEYATFWTHLMRERVKLFHFIGTKRFMDDYFANRGREQIGLLNRGVDPSGVAMPSFGDAVPREDDKLPLAFARRLKPASVPRYLAWRLGGRKDDVWLQFRDEAGADGVQFQLRRPSAGNNDLGVAYEIFVHDYLFPPARIPPPLVRCVVDMGANVGFSCLFWLSAFPGAHVVAFEPHPGHIAQLHRNIARNGYDTRIEVHPVAAGTAAGTARLTDAGTSAQVVAEAAAGFDVEIRDVFPELAGRRIDILKIDIEGGEIAILDDPRFATLDVAAVVIEWHLQPDGTGSRAWCLDRLAACGFRTYPVMDEASYGIVWGYRIEA